MTDLLKNSRGPQIETLPLVWNGKIIPNYYINNNGILFHDGKIVTGWKTNGRNYAHIIIDGHNWSYRKDYMVAHTFLKKPEDAIRLIHINGFIDDDRAKNLIWFRKSDVLKEHEKYIIIEDDGSVKEEWRNCNTEYNPDLGYEVSNFGLIRDKDHKLVKLHISHGYKAFYYLDPSHGNSTRIKLVHRAVAEAFIPNPNNYALVNHLDGNKCNDMVFNLEWVNKGMNSEHAYLTNLNLKNSYSKNQIEAVCQLLVEKIPQIQIELMTGVDRKVISDIYRGRRWREISSKYTMPKKKWTPELKKTISDMIIKGMKGKEIYAQLNIPYEQDAISLYERTRRELKAAGKI